MHIHQTFELARKMRVPRLDVQLMLSRLLAQPRAWLLAHDDTELLPGQVAALHAMLQRRAAGEPLAYITGQTEFRGLVLQVSPAVLIPRPETELLVEWALALLPADAPADVAELGTGSGAIALALQRERPRWRLTATDISQEALAVARANAARHEIDVSFAAGDWWRPLAGRRFALALSNPPYVAANDPHLQALGHEPRQALTPEHNGPEDGGLGALRRIVEGAPPHLLPGGWLLLEHGHDQGDAVRRMLSDRGFGATATRADLAGLPRCSGGRWPIEK